MHRRKTFVGPCVFEKSGADFPDVSWLRSELEAKRFRALGEITAQYAGISPADSRLEPCWALAEEYDVPAGEAAKKDSLRTGSVPIVD